MNMNNCFLFLYPDAENINKFMHRSRTLLEPNDPTKGEIMQNYVYYKRNRHRIDGK